MAVTIKQIAESVGVSTNVVSKVLNNGGTTVRVGEKTRRRVLEMADRLGYRPNTSARSMRRGRTNAIALLLPTSPEAAFLPNAFPQRVAQQLADREMSMTLAVLPDERLTSEGYVPRILRELSVDGLLINYISNAPPKLAELIERHRVPAIWLNTIRPQDCVRPDDVAGGREAAQRLIDLGHRHIEFVKFGDAGHYSVGAREAGIAQAMRAAGLIPRTFARPWVPFSMHLDRTREDRLLHAVELLRRTDRPTALIAYSPSEALPILHAAALLGVRLPRDLSLIVFSDYLVDHDGIPITTYAQSATALAKASVDLLVQKIEDPNRSMPAQAVAFKWYEGLTVSPPHDVQKT